MTSTEQRDYAAFERLMSEHVAQLTDFAKPYVGKLSSADREAFMAKALEYAWQRRAAFSGQISALLAYWGTCLKAAAVTRRFWFVSTFDSRWQRVLGTHLGQEI